MAPRAVGASLADFQRHWREEHAEAAEQIPGLRGYVQNHAVLDDAGLPLLPYPGFDACAETVFDDLTTMDAGFASPQYQQTVRADEDLLIDKPRFFMLLCERNVVYGAGGETDGYKLMTFLRAHPLAGRDELLSIAAGPYAELVRAAGALRHVQLVPSPELHHGRGEPSCDLVDCVWFGDTEQAQAFVNGRAGADADYLLAGRVFGRERLLARARVVRDVVETD